MPAMSYQMPGQLTTMNQAFTYPTSYPATTTSSAVTYPTSFQAPAMTYQAPTVYQSPTTYQAPMGYTTSSYVQTGTSSAGATFDMLDQNKDGVITKQEFSTIGQQ